MAGRLLCVGVITGAHGIRGEVKIGPAADIYGLGATFYHMVTGRVPFEGKNPSAVMHKHLKADLVPPDHLNPKLSGGCAQVIEMMMAKKQNAGARRRTKAVDHSSTPASESKRKVSQATGSESKVSQSTGSTSKVSQVTLETLFPKKVSNQWDEKAKKTQASCRFESF